MIFKEESILFFNVFRHLTEDEWINIYNESDEIGYANNCSRREMA